MLIPVLCSAAKLTVQITIFHFASLLMVMFCFANILFAFEEEQMQRVWTQINLALYI